MNPYLRPMSAPEILLGALRLFRDHLAMLVLVALLPHLVLLGLELLLIAQGQPPPGLLFAFMAVTIAVNAIALAAVTTAAGAAVLGRERGVGETYGATFRGNVLAVVLVYLFTAISVSFGFMFLILPGLLIGALFAPVIPIAVLERRRVFDAVTRSIELMRGSLVKGLAVFVYFIVVAGFVPLLTVVLQTGAGGGPFTPLLGAVVGSVTLPLGFCANVVLYLSLRSGEGYSQAQLAEDLGLPAEE